MGATIGLIADTHGLLRPQALAALQGSDYIIHAGDIGKEAVLEGLAKVAETFAIRGNVDRDLWAEAIPEFRQLQLAGLHFYLLHDLKQLDFRPEQNGIHVVVAGHSHKAVVKEESGVLYINPGSAGPRRFRLPVSVGKLYVEGGRARAEIIELEV